MVKKENRATSGCGRGVEKAGVLPGRDVQADLLGCQSNFGEKLEQFRNVFFSNERDFVSTAFVVVDCLTIIHPDTELRKEGGGKGSEVLHQEGFDSFLNGCVVHSVSQLRRWNEKDRGPSEVYESIRIRREFVPFTHNKPPLGE